MVEDVGEEEGLGRREVRSSGVKLVGGLLLDWRNLGSHDFESEGSPIVAVRYVGESRSSQWQLNVTDTFVWRHEQEG